LISQDSIQELHQRCDVVEIIGSYAPLKRRGRTYSALCPFHNEKTASFVVYPDTQSFYCFGCGAGGDVITFVMKQENLDYIEAVRFLAERVGMRLNDDGDDDEIKRKKRVLQANRLAARFFFDCLNTDEGKNARAYLRRRGLSDATIKRFGIGYSMPEWSALRDNLRSQGFKDDELIEAGLCQLGKNGGSYDAFRGRVMFPIIDIRGNVVAFGARTLGDDKPKYINTSDTPAFKKTRNLFALNIAKNNTERRLILVEGYMDVIAMHQGGFTNTVATLGTALTADQARIMSQYADEIVISYDSDEAGQKATRRAIDLLKNEGLNVKVLHIEGAKDPDEYIKAYGSERFSALVNGSHGSVEYELENAKSKYGIQTAEGSVRFLREAAEVLARCRSVTEREVYASRIAAELNISKDAILAQVDDILRRNRNRERSEQEKMLSDIPGRLGVPASRRDEVGAAAAERRLLALLFANPDMKDKIKQLITREDFYSEQAADIFETMCRSIEQGGGCGFHELAPLLDSDKISALAGIVAVNSGVNFTEADATFLCKKMVENRNRLTDEKIAATDPEALKKLIEKNKK